MARTADLVIIMLDATKNEVHRQLLEKELESVGIRLNKKRPNIYFKVSQRNFPSTFAVKMSLVFAGEKIWKFDFYTYVQSDKTRRKISLWNTPRIQ